MSSIRTITPHTESIRLSRSGMHQGRAIAVQAEVLGLKVTAPGVILEISREALKMASLFRQSEDNRRVNPVVETLPADMTKNSQHKKR